jgi:prepilin-type N-terminal cleavage/methylation domain-containing protein
MMLRLERPGRDRIRDYGQTAPSRADSTDQRSTDQRSTVSGITLIELLVVVAIIGLMVSISFPTLTTGLDGFRLRGAVDRAGTLFQRARVEADRRQQPVQFSADPRTNQLRALAVDASWRETLDLADGVRIVQPPAAQSWLLFPGSPPPQVRVLLEARTGGRRGFSISVFTGVAEDWKGPEER